MPLVSARDFNLNPRHDISPLADALREAITGHRQQQEVQRLEQIQVKKQALKTTGAQFLRLRDIDNLQTQKRELAKLGQAALQRGEDISVFEEGLRINKPDDMNLFLSRIITRATDAGKILDEHAKAQGGGGFTLSPGQQRYDTSGNVIAENGTASGGEGLASAKTEILPTGATIQAMPDSSVIVRNPLGEIIEGEERLKILKEAQDSKIYREEESARIAIDKAQKVEAAKSREQRISGIRTEMSDRNRLAARSEVRLTRALKLANQATQGLSGDLKVQFAKLFPDIDVTDEASLSQSMRLLALDELQKFKGPTTDFEFGVAESTVGALGDPKTANIARIKSILRNNWFNSRETEQFNRHVDNGGDPEAFRFNFGEPVQTKKGVFTLRQLQDTAVENNLTIDEVIKRLNK